VVASAAAFPPNWASLRPCPRGTRVARIPRHLYRLSRDDPREDIREDVGVGIVEFWLVAHASMPCRFCRMILNVTVSAYVELFVFMTTL